MSKSKFNQYIEMSFKDNIKDAARTMASPNDLKIVETTAKNLVSFAKQQKESYGFEVGDIIRKIVEYFMQDMEIDKFNYDELMSRIKNIPFNGAPK